MARVMEYSYLGTVVGLVSGILATNIYILLSNFPYSSGPCTCVFPPACRRDQTRVSGCRRQGEQLPAQILRVTEEVF